MRKEIAVLGVLVLLVVGVLIYVQVGLREAASELPPTGSNPGGKGMEPEATEKPTPLGPGKIRVGYWRVNGISDPGPGELPLLARCVGHFDCLVIAGLGERPGLEALEDELERDGDDWDHFRDGGVAFLWRLEKLRPGLSPTPASALGLSMSFRYSKGTGGLSIYVLRKPGPPRRLDEVPGLKSAGKPVLIMGTFDRLPESRRFVRVPEDGAAPWTGGTSARDLILFPGGSPEQYAGEHGVDPFDKIVFRGDRERAGRIASHRPVWVVLDLK